MMQDHFEANQRWTNAPSAVGRAAAWSALLSGRGARSIGIFASFHCI